MIVSLETSDGMSVVVPAGGSTRVPDNGTSEVIQIKSDDSSVTVELDQHTCGTHNWSGYFEFTFPGDSEDLLLRRSRRIESFSFDTTDGS